MDIQTFDDLLQTLADGNTIDYQQWPALQSRIITKLERICQVGLGPELDDTATSFEVPSSPPSQVAETASQKSNSSNDKENAPPHTSSKRPRITELLKSITCTLNTLFSKHPPHTVQRLAELVLNPRRHYKTLTSYLHAVDRVVHVTSGAHIFPLPPAVPDPSSTVVLSNGDPLLVSWGNPATQNSLGSDESLGGALLTPISWLTKSHHNGNTHSPMEGDLKTESTEMIDGPNGLGGIETVTVSLNGISSTRADSTVSPPNETNGVVSLRAEGGVTQGELLRQEQRAGVVPVTQLSHRGSVDGLGEMDELPHARGPEEIGMEDTGPQPTESRPSIEMRGIDVEAAVGLKEAPTPETEEMKATPPSTPKREAEEELESESKRLKESSNVDTEAMEEDTKDPDPSPEEAAATDEDTKMDGEKPANEAAQPTKELEASAEA